MQRISRHYGSWKAETRLKLNAIAKVELNKTDGASETNVEHPRATGLC
jgi:hypothetical protein